MDRRRGPGGGALRALRADGPAPHLFTGLGAHTPKIMLSLPASSHRHRESTMAKGQMKPNKEKKKPKADKNKKPKHQPFGGATPQGQTGHPGFNPFAKKT
jgi:hypothetical protein